MVRREKNQEKQSFLKSVLPPDPSDAYTKIGQFFFDCPNQETGLNELCRRLKISKTTANLNIKKLAKEGFLKVRTFGRLWMVSCNHRHRFNLTRKIPYHLQMIFESGIIEAVHKKIPNSKSIILFGSYRKGDDNENSDVDLAVEIAGSQELKIINFGAVPQLGYRLKVPVSLHIFSREKINLNLFANIANGIVLEGFLEVKP